MSQLWKRNAAIICVISIGTVLVYSLPSLWTKRSLGSSNLPPIFAPDLTLYLSVSNFSSLSGGEGLNPYYRIPVPKNGAGYLKFDLAERLFRAFENVLGNQTAPALLYWNAFWLICLCISAVCMFERFLPGKEGIIKIFGLFLLMFFNFGVAKTILRDWEHVLSPQAFDGVYLPFMRAFVPVIPCVLLLLYIWLQMENIRRPRVAVWLAMAILQLLGVAIFPYATLLMAGATAASLVASWHISAAKKWLTVGIYAVVCGLIDLSFLLRGSIGFYEDRSPAIHLQPQVLPHLIGWSWILLVGLTISVAVRKGLPAEARWPLTGLGATNALLMLGDAAVPATKILLSHHAAHFLHMTVAILLTFLAASLSEPLRTRAPRLSRVSWAVLTFSIGVTGLLIARAEYRNFLTMNRDAAALAKLPNRWSPAPGDLIIARSEEVDDACGWLSLVATTPVLYCTDAEVMLTPQQNRAVHRFRQALYLYFTGESSSCLQHKLASRDSLSVMYRLGYWAEASSYSMPEREYGLNQINVDLIPALQKVEQRDSVVSAFFRGYRRIIVVDKRSFFDVGKLGTFLKLENQERLGEFAISIYSPY